MNLKRTAPAGLRMRRATRYLAEDLEVFTGFSAGGGFNTSMATEENSRPVNGLRPGNVAFIQLAGLTWCFVSGSVPQSVLQSVLQSVQLLLLAPQCRLLLVAAQLQPLGLVTRVRFSGETSTRHPCSKT